MKGEQEEVNVIKKIERTFNYEEDLEEFGKKLDKIQRKNLDRNDTDSVYIATTNLIDVLNKIKTNNILPEDIEKALRDLKAEEKELPKDKFNILEVNKNTKQIGFKLILQSIVQNVTKALEKGIIPESLPVYKAINENLLNNKEINVFNINPEIEMKEAVEEFGENTIKLTGVPTVCIDIDNKELFLETLDEINAIARTAKQEKEEKFIATVACKAAVKANMVLDKAEVENLMDKLLELPNPFTCPHGRPTAIKMSKYDIERKFARK